MIHLVLHSELQHPASNLHRHTDDIFTVLSGSSQHLRDFICVCDRKKRKNSHLSASFIPSFSLYLYFPSLLWCVSISEFMCIDLFGIMNITIVMFMICGFNICIAFIRHSRCGAAVYRSALHLAVCI